MHQALAELTAKRDALNDIIAALENFVGSAAETPVPVEARSPQPRRTVVKPVPVSRRSKPDSDRRAAPTGARADQSNEREQAILAALKRNDGVASSAQLRAAMPKEPTLTDDQRLAAYRNSLHRLKVKGLIDRTGDTWSIVGIGGASARDYSFQGGQEHGCWHPDELSAYACAFFSGPRT